MELRWYAIYTKHNAEQTLRESILNYSQRNNLSYEIYLPLREEVKKWRDRINVRKIPLFRNYLFVKHDDNAFYKLKTMKGFYDYVRFGASPRAIPIQQMEMIKKIVEHHPVVYCQANKSDKGNKGNKGRKARVFRGDLVGLEGVLFDENRDNIIAVEVKSLNLCFQIKVPAADVVII